MSGTNTYKEHLLYNENKRNAKNIDIVFDSRQLFDSYKYFTGAHHPRENFMDPRHFIWPTPKFYEPAPPTLPTLFSRIERRTQMRIQVTTELLQGAFTQSGLSFDNEVLHRTLWMKDS